MSDTLTPEEVERQQRTIEAMEAAGVSTEEAVYADYFGFEETEIIKLPDGRSTVTIQALNEGGRRRYLNKVNREVVIAKGTGDAKMQMANGDERRILLEEAIIGWDLQTRNRVGDMVAVPFSRAKLAEFLEKGNPTVIDVIDKAVRKQNAWLLAEVTLEDLQKQRDELDEQIERKRAEEEGKES